jgi:hypothetical protein
MGCLQLHVVANAWNKRKLLSAIPAANIDARIGLSSVPVSSIVSSQVFIVEDLVSLIVSRENLTGDLRHMRVHHQ